MTSTQAIRPLGSTRRALDRSHLTAMLRRGAPLGALLSLTATLYLWSLGRNGYGNDFYAAAVKAGTESWKAFFFGSFDAANFITVDKPPASLWLMELSARLFGFSSVSMLLPQALEGIVAVALLYATVKRWFSTPAALAAGVILALTPVAALMFRFNNPDALLLALLVVAAYAVTRALEHGQTRWLVLAATAIGFGFLTKMMEAFVVVPAFALVYLIAAPTALRRRLWQLVVAGGALIAAAGWWVAIVALVPAADRPYVGGSTNNSILNLIWDYNGIGRIDGSGGPGGGAATFSGSPGALRLFNSELGGQISWLLPAALLMLAAGLLATARAPRRDHVRAALVLWGGWLVVTGGVFSLMSGIIHPYYTNILAAPIAALVGVGAVEAWRRRSALAARALLAFAVLVTAALAYHLLDRTPSWHPTLRVVVVIAALAAASGIAAAGRLPRSALVVVASAAVVAALVGPLAYTLNTVARAETGSLVAAGPASSATLAGGPGGGFAAGGRRFAGGGFPGGPPGAGGGAIATGGFGGGPPPSGIGGFGGLRAPGGGSTPISATLARLLEQASESTTWIAATPSAQTAAPIELATGRSVMAIGGFTGSDPAITLTRFKALVDAGKIGYFIAGGAGPVAGPGGGGPGREGVSAALISSWVERTFAATTVAGTTVYTLHGSSGS